MFGRLGMPELLVVFFVVFLLFGARRLPEIAKAIGKSLTQFKKGLKEAEIDIKSISQETLSDET